MRRRITKFSDSKVIVLKSINEANLQDCTVVSIGLMVEGLHFPQMPCTPYQIEDDKVSSHGQPFFAWIPAVFVEVVLGVLHLSMGSTAFPGQDQPTTVTETKTGAVSQKLIWFVHILSIKYQDIYIRRVFHV